ncbi:MAG TPA: DUF2764 domain-containing protein [Candidatus Coprenecus pullistercoris]|nr:DUF2764 domain-containing protein [Candidatus Coprenecus pullistercoris]
MNNYHYIIAGLPELMPDFSSGTFSYGDIAATIKEQLSRRDRRYVDWLEFGADSSRLCSHFYRAAERQGNAFIRSYYAMDRRLRNAQTIYLAEKDGKDSSRYTVGETDSAKEALRELIPVFQNGDLFEREHSLDRYRWERITEMTLFHYFDMDVILAFMAKGMIVDRWSSLDKDKGAELFRLYVDEVRGTFKGTDFR